MCAMALGTDTRGSVRVPAALCGVTGFKPTARRVPRDGAFPLSYTLDSVGPMRGLGRGLRCVRRGAGGGAFGSANGLSTCRGLRLLLPRSSVLDDLEPAVASAFDAALATLIDAGALVDRRADAGVRSAGASTFAPAALPVPRRIRSTSRRLDRIDEYDPRVGKRIMLGSDLSGADYVELGRLRDCFDPANSNQRLRRSTRF